MANYIVSDTDLTSVADAIREKSGGSSLLSWPDGWKSEIESISGGGYSIDDIALGKTSISGDIAIGLSGGQFLRDNAFAGTSITSVSAPNLQRCESSCFKNCKSLLSADLPSLAESSTLYGGSFFSGCTALKTVNMPYMRQGAVSLFDGCTSLEVYVNKATYSQGISASAFRNCTSLQILDFTYLTQIAATWAYDNDNALTTLILRRADAVIPCSSAAAVPPVFRSGGAGGTIYIPKVLYDELGTGSSLDYKAATNWSTLDGYGTITWAQIEGSIYETQYADGTAISS